MSPSATTTTTPTPSGSISVNAILIDTSAFYALVSATDNDHAAALRYWARSRDVAFVTHGYVVAETLALVRKRLGAAAVRRVIGEFVPRIDVLMVDRALHDLAVSHYFAEAGGTSFVDRVSIEFARREGIRHAFAFDQDLVSAGLTFPESSGGGTE